MTGLIGLHRNSATKLKSQFNIIGSLHHNLLTKSSLKSRSPPTVPRIHCPREFCVTAAFRKKAHRTVVPMMRIDVDELFHEVADLSAEARAQYFREHGTGTATRQEIEALLKFDSGVSDSLDTDITQVAEFALRRLESQDKVGELLGRGGMGSVYLAERIDGAVTHQAAVKLLRPGADDPQIRQRFLAE